MCGFRVTLPRMDRSHTAVEMVPCPKDKAALYPCSMVPRGWVRRRIVLEGNPLARLVIKEALPRARPKCRRSAERKLGEEGAPPLIALGRTGKGPSQESFTRETRWMGETPVPGSFTRETWSSWMAHGRKFHA